MLDDKQEEENDVLEKLGSKLNDLYTEMQRISNDFAFLQRNMDGMKFQKGSDIEERELAKLKDWEGKLKKKEEEVSELQTEGKKRDVLNKLVELENCIEKLSGELFVIGKESSEKLGFVNQALDSLKEENTKLKKERDEAVTKSKVSLQSLNNSMNRKDRGNPYINCN